MFIKAIHGMTPIDQPGPICCPGCFFLVLQKYYKIKEGYFIITQKIITTQKERSCYYAKEL
jgi:hypothetical protein